jgi:hypothetical protein
MPPPYCRLAEHADMRSSLSSGFQDVTVAAFACEMGYPRIAMDAAALTTL